MKTKLLALLCASLVAMTAFADGETMEDMINACGPPAEPTLSSSVCQQIYVDTFVAELEAYSFYVPHSPAAEFVYLSTAGLIGSALEDRPLTSLFSSYTNPEPMSSEDALHGASQQFRQSVRARFAASCPNLTAASVTDAAIGSLLMMSWEGGRLCSNPGGTVDDYPTMLRAMESTLAAMPDTDRADLCAIATATNMVAAAIRQCQERTPSSPSIHEGTREAPTKDGEAPGVTPPRENATEV